ncbi:hypothetical protein EDB80DRAFT_194516 [Ilyonectria destructans]|nr:hypothetical protein EDB80DRAFT_194516 [Ilyonectria destructans]
MCDMRAKIGSSGRLLWKMSVVRKQSLRLWVAGMMMTSLLTYARPKLVGEARILDGTVSGRANGLVMGAQRRFGATVWAVKGWSRAGRGCECRHEGDDGGGSAGLIRRARGGRGRDRRGRSTGKESDEGRRDATQGDGAVGCVDVWECGGVEVRIVDRGRGFGVDLGWRAADLVVGG